MITAAAALAVLQLVAYGLSLHRGGFAQPDRGLWPPEQNEKQYKVIVFVDGLHSEIGLWTADDPQGRDFGRLEAWSYGEKKYYMQGQTGIGGMARAALIPTAGVIRVHRAGWRFRDRAHLPEKVWSFYVSREGHERVLAHVRSARSSATALRRTELSQWYPAKRSYHGLHNCHHWTAEALRKAGLPIWTSHAHWRWSLERQLDRAEKMAGNRPT